MAEQASPLAGSGDKENASLSPRHKRARLDDDAVQAKAEEIIAASKRSAFFEVLGIASTATEREVIVSYRRLALLLHPDKTSAPCSLEAFKAVSNAKDAILAKVFIPTTATPAAAPQQKPRPAPSPPPPPRPSHSSGFKYRGKYDSDDDDGSSSSDDEYYDGYDSEGFDRYGYDESGVSREEYESHNIYGRERDNPCPILKVSAYGGGGGGGGGDGYGGYGGYYCGDGSVCEPPPLGNRRPPRARPVLKISKGLSSAATATVAARTAAAATTAAAAAAVTAATAKATTDAPSSKIVDASLLQEARRRNAEEVARRTKQASAFNSLLFSKKKQVATPAASESTKKPLEKS